MEKTVLITGSTDGIGKLAALQMAKQGHEVILHGRNEEKLKASLEEIKEQSSNEKIRAYLADFSRLVEVKKMAVLIASKESKIDVLINNAGVFKSNNPRTEDGLDIRFAVNYFAPFILSQKLHDLLKASKSSRIINISSAAQSSVSLRALLGEEEISAQEAYAQSKLAIAMWSFHLASNGISESVALNPGSLLNTKMVQEAYGQYWSSASKGAEIICDLALTKKHYPMNCKYYDNDAGSFGPAHEDAYDEKRLNDLLESSFTYLKERSLLE